MNTLVILVVLAAALVLATGLAFVPMRRLLTHMAANIRQIIVRQRERRDGPRSTTERRRPV